MEQHYISVSVEDGMFSGEKSVSFALPDRRVTLLVDEGDLHRDKLRVNVVDRSSSQVLIDLPREPFSGSSRLMVPASFLTK